MQTRIKQIKNILFLTWLFVAFFAFDKTAFAAANTPSLSLSSSTISVQINLNEFNILKTGNTTISVTTTNPTGYTLTLATSGTNTNLVSGSNTIPTLTANSSSNNFPIGRWGYSLDNNTFKPAPSKSGSGDVLASTTVSNTMANSYELYVGAKVANTQPSGNYTNSFTVTAVANPINYTLSFNANGGSNNPATQTVSSNAESHTFTIPSSNPTKTGYTFKGWCSSTISGNNGTSAPSCSGSSYSSGASVTLSYTSPSLTLNAMWQRNTATVKLGTKVNVTKVYYGTSVDAINTELTTSGFTATSNTTYYFRADVPAGYTFSAWSGWFTGSDDTYSTGKSFTTNGGTYTVNADAAANPYTVTFKSYDGATTYGTQSFTYGTSAALRARTGSGWTVTPTAPVNKVFYGWSITSNSTTRSYTDGQSVSNLTTTYNGDFVLYAVWVSVPTTYQITFNPNNNTSFTLNGTTYTSTTSFDLCTTTIVYNGEAVPTSCTGSMTLPTVNAPTGFTVAGWSTTSTGTYNPDYSSGATNVSLTSGTTLYAQSYKPDIVYTATPLKNVSSATGSTSSVSCVVPAVYNGATQGTTCSVNLPNNGFTLTGWTFNGWVGTGTSSTTAETSGLSPQTTLYLTGSTNIVATWKKDVEVTLNVAFNANGGSEDLSASTVVTRTLYNGNTTLNTTVSIIAPACTTYTGFTCLGYDSSSTATTASWTAGTSKDFAINAEIPLSVSTLTSARTVYHIWQANNFTIVYNGNGGAGSMSGYQHANVSEGSSINLYSSNFSRSGYGFAGWSFNSNSTVNGSSTIYGPNATITIPSGVYAQYGSSGTLNLYAVWVASEGTLQSWIGCSSLSSGAITALTDVRDNHTYAIAKLGDGNCWMIENLRFDPANKTITTSNTNSPTFDFVTKAAAVTSSSFDACNYGVTYCKDTYSVGIGNVTGSSSSPNSGGQPSRWFSYGAIYNWYTATAGNGTYNMASGTTAGDICPAGWHLPYGGSSGGAGGGNTVGGFYYLAYAIGAINNNASSSTILRNYPNNFVYSGAYVNSVTQGRGSYSELWSSTASSNSNVFYTYFGATEVNYTNKLMAKSNGLPVRCIISNASSYLVHFNPNTNIYSGEMLDQVINVGQTTSLSKNLFTRSVSSYSGYRFTGWNTNSNGTGTSYRDEDDVLNLTTAGNTFTLYAQWEQVAVMRVNYQANNLYFGNSSSVVTNTVYYYNSCSPYYVSSPSYSHTANINDSGVASGTYATNLATKDVVTIAGADFIRAEIYYSTENNWDMLYVFQGEYTGSVTRSMSAGQLMTYQGGGKTDYANATHVTLDIPGDKATFAFYSDSSNQYYGYYVVATGYYANNPGSYASINQVCSREVVSGSYKVPTTTEFQKFLGWNTSSSATSATYVTHDDILNNLSGSNSQTITVYAIWQKLLKVNFNGNGASSGATAPAYIPENSSGLLTANGYLRDGYKFVKWTTSSDGTGSSYLNGAYYNVGSISLGAQVTLYANWTMVYSFAYNGNGADSGTGYGDMANIKQTNIGINDYVGLFASNYSRSGYGFLGWSTTQSSSTDRATLNNQISAGTLKVYGPNEAVLVDSNLLNKANSNKIITFYAVWMKAETSGSTPVYLQSWTGCSVLTATTYNSSTLIQTPGSVYALTDRRDNNVYAVAKLADGNCWMIENLRISSGATTSSTYSQGYGSGFSGLADSEYTNFSNSTTANTKYSTTNITGSNQGYRFPRFNNYNIIHHTSETTIDYNPSFTASFAASSNNEHPTNLNVPIYSYGNYYTWAAATANINDNTSLVSVSTSLCPTGWTIPYGGASEATGNRSGGFYYLGSKIGATSSNTTSSRSLRTFPNNFVFAGSYYNSSISNRGYSINYWTSTNIDNVQAYYTSITYSSVALSPSVYKYYGYPVRCVKIAASNITLSFNANGGSGAPTSQTVSSSGSVTFTIPSTLPTYIGRNFLGWSTSSTASSASYSPGSSITISSSTVLYAVWGSVSISLGSNGVSAPISYAGQYYYFTFTPPRTTSYTFYSTGSTDTYGHLYNASGAQLTSDDDSGVANNFNVTYTLTANTTYYYAARYYSASNTGTISVGLAKTAQAISTNVTYAATVDVPGEIVYYQFTPSSAGTYTLTGTSTVDNYAYIYDADFNQLYYDDDSGGNSQFQLSYTLSAGTTYYYGVKYYSASNVGSFTFILTSGGGGSSNPLSYYDDGYFYGTAYYNGTRDAYATVDVWQSDAGSNTLYYHFSVGVADNWFTTDTIYFSGTINIGGVSRSLSGTCVANTYQSTGCQIQEIDGSVTLSNVSTSTYVSASISVEYYNGYSGITDYVDGSLGGYLSESH